MTFEEWWEIEFHAQGSAIGFDQKFARYVWNAAKAEGAREEREGCAKLCEEYYLVEFSRPLEYGYDVNLQDAIRARGEGETLAD